MSVKKSWIKKSLCVFFTVMGVLSVSACQSKTEKAVSSADIITQKKTDSDRTQISILVKYAFSINGFEEAVENKFPDIDIVQVGNYTHNMGIDEYASRLEHDDLTDIVMTWPLEVGEEYWEDRLIDLSGMSFTDQYELSMLNKISKNGKLYYLPGPSQIRGIVYNKTMFEEQGWSVPKNYEEFVQLCQTIEQSGIRSIQLGFNNSEVLDAAFMGYNYGNYFSSPQDIQWIDDYNNGIGSFGEHFGGALDVFQEMMEAGIWKSSDLQVNYTERERMLFNRECAMIEDSVLLCRMGYQQAGNTDEFALMPFFNPGDDQSDWARLYMVCYIGLNKHLEEEGNEEKFELVKKLMEYVSSEEGQKALSSDTGGMMSSVSGVQPPDVPEIDELRNALTHGHYAVFTPLVNAQTSLRQGLAGMLDGSMTKEDVIDSVDLENKSPSRNETAKKIGTATEDFTLIDTGSYVTDVLKEYGKTDIALFMDNGMDGNYNGKGISGKIYKGDVTVADIGRVLPDLKAGDEGLFWKGSITGENLKKTLEYAIPVENNKVGWFYYFSGLKMEYDPCAEQGSRIKSITTAEGKDIVDSQKYSLSIMGGTVLEESLSTCEKTDVTIGEILQQAIEKAETISPAKDGRFVIPE